MRKALFKAKMTSILDVNKIWNLRKLYDRFIGFFSRHHFDAIFFNMKLVLKTTIRRYMCILKKKSR